MAPIYTLGRDSKPPRNNYRGFDVFDAYTSENLGQLSFADIEDKSEELIGRKVTPQEFNTLIMVYGSNMYGDEFLLILEQQEKRTDPFVLK